MNRQSPVFAVLLAAFFALAPLTPSAAAQDPERSDETFRGDVLVREVELIFELPELKTRKPGRPVDLKAEDLIVTEDGIPREVMRVGPVVGGFLPGPDDRLVPAPAWGVVLYFDGLLASADTQFQAALALAERAAELTRMGTVAVVIADPEPRQVLAPTRNTQDVERALGAISGEARVRRDRVASEGRALRTLPDLRRQSDRLLTHVAGRDSGGPRALFLVADGFDLTPREVNRLAAAGQGREGQAGQAAAHVSRETILPPITALFEETARTLSAYGWVTVSLPLRKDGLGRENNQPSDTERIRQTTAGRQGAERMDGLPPVISFEKPDRSTLRYEGVVDAFVQRASAPLMALAHATAGTMIAFDEQVEPALKGLSDRWHLYYATPDAVDGQVRPVEVRLRGSAQPLRTRRWVRSSTPETVSAARLRLALGGASQDGGLKLAVGGPVEGVRQIQLSLPAQPVEEGEQLATLRLSLAYEKADGTFEVRHETIQGAEMNQGWKRTVAIQPPDGARRMAVLLEDLGRERWDAEVVSLPGGTPAR